MASNRLDAHALLAHARATAGSKRRRADFFCCRCLKLESGRSGGRGEEKESVGG
jgi:hypothetical protein